MSWKTFRILGYSSCLPRADHDLTALVEILELQIGMYCAWNLNKFIFQ